MEYRISDIAELFNLSKQMIRYYEECGVIRPRRTSDNNYRVYDAVDFFALSEAIGLSRFDINIKDIGDVKKNNYTSEMKKNYQKYIDATNEEIAYKKLLINRASVLCERLEMAELNIENTWVKKISAQRCYPLLKSHDDFYGEIELTEEMKKIVASAKAIPFGDAIYEKGTDEDTWWLSFDQEYVKGLKLSYFHGCRDIEARYVVCHIIDMGDIGDFKSNKIDMIRNKIQALGYVLSNEIYGVLLYRGGSSCTYKRLLELQMPIK